MKKTRRPDLRPARHGRTLLFRLMLATLLVASAKAAQAEEAPPTLLPPMMITAWQNDAPSPLSTITPLKPTQGTRPVEVLGSIPGLLVQDSFGGFDPPRLSVRGSGIQSAPSSRGLALSLFGMPLNAADGSFNLAVIDSSWLGSASVTRGTPAGVPALGGTLDFTADPFIMPRLSLGAAYGSHDSLSVRASGWWDGEQTTIAARTAYARSDGWRPYSSQERSSLHLATRHRISDKTDVILQVLASNPSYEVPGPMTRSQALNDPTARLPVITRDRPRRDTDYVHLNATANHRAEDTTFALALGVVHTDDTFYQLLPNGISSTEALDTYIRLSADHAWPGDTHRSIVQALLQAGWWDALRHRNDRGEKGLLIADQSLRPLTLTTMIDHQIQPDGPFGVDFGVSTLTARREINDNVRLGNTAEEYDDGTSTRLAPRLALSWHTTPTITMVASYSRSYEPPAYGDLLYTAGAPTARVLRVADLTWQRADTVEIGGIGRSGPVAWSAFLYHAWWHHELLRLVDETGAPRGTVHADDTIHKGFEIGLHIDLLRGGSFAVGLDTVYTYTDARFDDDAVLGNRRLGGVPPHSGRAALSATHDTGWFAATACDFRGGTTYADHAGTLSYGSTALFSLEIGRRRTEGWSVIAAVDNLLDRAAIASTAGVLERTTDPESTPIFQPAAARAFSLRIEYAW